MKVLPVVSAFLVGASALTLPEVSNGEALVPAFAPRSLLEFGKRADMGRGQGEHPSDMGNMPDSQGYRPIDGQDPRITDNTQEQLRAAEHMNPVTESVGQMAQRPTRGSNGRLKADGTSGWYPQKQPDGSYHVELYYGNNLAGHELHLQFNQRINGQDPANPRKYQLADAATHEANRKILDGLPTNAINHRDEKMLASEYHPDDIQTVMAIPAKEGNKEGAMSSAAIAFMRDQASKGVSTVLVKYSNVQKNFPVPKNIVRYLKGPEVQFQNAKWTPLVPTQKKVITLAVTGPDSPKSPSAAGPAGAAKRRHKLTDTDVSGSSSRGSRKMKREEFSSELFGTIFPSRVPTVATPVRRQLGPVTSNDGNNVNHTEQYVNQESDYWGYTIDAQNQIADLIWPVIVNMTTDCMSMACYDMALSLFVDLTRAPIAVEGNYYNGLTTFPDQQAQAAANNTNPAAMDMMQYVDAILWEDYSDAWDNATALVNATTLQSDLDLLANYTSVQDESLLPPEANVTDPNAGQQYSAFLQDHNFTISWQTYIDNINASTAFDINPNATSVGNATDGGNSTNSTVLARYARRPVALDLSD